MRDPVFWYAMSGMLALAGLLHFRRGLRRTDARRGVNLWLGGSSFLWALMALAYRFVGTLPAYVFGFLAAGCMVWAAIRGMRQA